MNRIHKVTVIILSIVFILLLTSCSVLGEREYYDDIIIELDNTDGQIVIKEWSYLLGSGAEVYYLKNKKETLLGKISGADDGWYPFKAGQYTVEVTENIINIKWLKKNDAWVTDSFTLPD